ncbi:phage DNA packaging protein J [Mycobacterium sp. HNNTM2301]
MTPERPQPAVGTGGLRKGMRFKAFR